MTMPTPRSEPWGLDLTQEQHDARHPGKICRTCPTNLESMRRLTEPPPLLWRILDRLMPWLVIAVLVGAVLLGSWLCGPS